MFIQILKCWGYFVIFGNNIFEQLGKWVDVNFISFNGNSYLNTFNVLGINELSKETMENQIWWVAIKIYHKLVTSKNALISFNIPHLMDTFVNHPFYCKRVNTFVWYAL